MLKCMKKILIACAGLAFIFGIVLPSFAADGGAGMVWIRSPYKGHDDYYLPVPALTVETKYFFIKNMKLGFYLYRDDAGENELTLGITPGSIMFNPSKTDDFQMSLLDKRRMAADVYLQYQKNYDFGTFGTKIFADALRNAEGFGADVFYKLPVFINQFTLTPGAGLEYLSPDRTDYYYGINLLEASRSGLPVYKADYSVSPYISMEANLQTESGWNFFAGMKYTFLSDEIADSPMIEDKEFLMFGVGATVSF